jgi:hypothetical protein
MYKEIKNKESNAEKGKRKPPLSIRDGFSAYALRVKEIFK